MKSLVKTFLSKMLLPKFPRELYRYFKGARPSVVYKECIYRIKGAPDKIPIPPSRFIFLVIGLKWCSIFLDSGKIIAANMIAALKKNGFDINGFNSIVDFVPGEDRKYYQQDIYIARKQ